MRIVPTTFPDIKLIEPNAFFDERGFFVESYHQKDLQELAKTFVQDNDSRSIKNVLRGLHYQINHPQGKLVRVSSGTVFDVSVDLRRSSPTFGNWFGIILTDAMQRLLWIPPGFAHGFLVLSDQADLHYKTTDYYDPSSERCLKWNDPDLAIEWPLIGGLPILSEKDSKGKALKDADVFP